jgi:hypothetical protein
MNNTVLLLATEVRIWDQAVKKCKEEFRKAYGVVHAYEAGHPYVQEEHDRILFARHQLDVSTKSLKEARHTLKVYLDDVEAAEAKEKYTRMWKNQPSLKEAYGEH